MSGFSAAWLTAREAQDHQARSGALADRFLAALGPAPTVLDLGCGAGSNLAYLVPRGAEDVRWIGIDTDADLLVWARRRFSQQTQIEFQNIDLNGEWRFGGSPDGIAASALLDLVATDWIERLVRLCVARPILIALTVDGRMAFAPTDADDGDLCHAFGAHQRIDKGFGPALGPAAAGYLEAALTPSHDVVTASADWRLGPDHRDLVHLYLDGVVAAATAIGGIGRFDRWAARRRAQADAGELSVTVGHQDVLGLPRVR